MERICDEKELLTVKDLRRILPLGRDRCYALMHSSGFPSMRIGRNFFVRTTALLEWLDSYQGKKFLL